MILKIISGGQTGSDFGGLLAGKELGIKTGGYCPANYRTENGSNILLKDFDLKCTKSSGYKIRTELNVMHSDGTIGFGKQNSPGMKLTSKLCVNHRKPYFKVSYPNRDILDFINFYDWVLVYNIQVLNVAGNRESKNPGIEQFTKEFLCQGITNLKKM